LIRAFLDQLDQWKDETTRRADVVMQSKHDELDKEMEFQLHLHEPRRARIETDIRNIRAGQWSRSENDKRTATFSRIAYA
jgi:hypothetical protein